MSTSDTPTPSASITKDNIHRVNYYALFGLPMPVFTHTAASLTLDETEMRRRYRRFSLLFHPDKDASPAARAAFEYVNLALETLLDESLRREYDRTLRGGGGSSSTAVLGDEALERRRAAAEAEEILKARDAQQRAAREAERQAAEAKATYSRQLVEELTRSTDTPFREMEAALVRDWDIDEDLLLQKESEVMGFLQELRRFYAQDGDVEEEDEGRQGDASIRGGEPSSTNLNGKKRRRTDPVD